MECERNAASGKRMRIDGEDGAESVRIAEDKHEAEAELIGSEEVQISIAQIYEKIDRYTQMVSEILESVKATFQELASEFEDRLILMHKEQTEKWQDEIKEIRMMDAANEHSNALIDNAKYLFQNTYIKE